jgi:ATP-dependent RNA helicase RhlE
MKTFSELGLCNPILRALEEEGYIHPTDIQAQAIPDVLNDRDLVATAQTGTGKTAAFALPMLELLREYRRGNRKKGPDQLFALIVTPTRELALQIDENLQAYGRHLPSKTTVVVGGVSQVPQVKSLKRNPDILVATPGRLLDLYEQGQIRLERIEMFVLDEADRMLDMGFLPDVRRIIDLLPDQRQTLLFSATMPKEVEDLAQVLLREPVRISVAPPDSVAEKVLQYVMFCERSDKKNLLLEVIGHDTVQRTLVFTRTKRRADRVAQQLTRKKINAKAIHSDKSQNQRQKALAAFHSGEVDVLVATDIVARGIDVDDITHVINYEMPTDPEAYVHRIGRTARAGQEGVALSFCDDFEMEELQAIEQLTGEEIPMWDEHPFHSDEIAALRKKKPKKKPKPQRGGGGKRFKGKTRRAGGSGKKRS